jgi:hypothetical protein
MRIDDDGGDLLGVAQTGIYANVLPALAGVGGFVDAVADREIRALETFAAAYINDARIGGRDRQGADGAGVLVVEDRFPDAPGVGALPNAAVIRGDVEDVRLSGNAAGGHSAAAAERPDHAPAESAVEFGREGLRAGDGHQHGVEQRAQQPLPRGAHACPPPNAAAARCCVSSGVRSSICVAMPHTKPDGSRSWP